MLSYPKKKKVSHTLLLGEGRKPKQTGGRDNNSDGRSWHISFSFSVGASSEVLHLPFLLSDLGLYWNHSSPHRLWFGFIMVERLSGCFSDVTIVHCDTTCSWDVVTGTNLAGWAMSKSQQVCPGVWGPAWDVKRILKRVFWICPSSLGLRCSWGRGWGLTLLCVPFPVSLFHMLNSPGHIDGSP